MTETDHRCTEPEEIAGHICTFSRNLHRVRIVPDSLRFQPISLQNRSDSCPFPHRVGRAWGPFSRQSTPTGGITCDIRAFAPDLAADAGEEALPPTHSQERRWSKTVRARLSTWVEEQALPIIEAGLGRASFGARIRADGERLYIDYEPLLGGGRGFVRPPGSGRSAVLLLHCRRAVVGFEHDPG